MVKVSGHGDCVDDHDGWFVRGPEGESGPLHRTELLARIRNGAIPPHALVRRGSSGQHWLARAFAAAEALIPHQDDCGEVPAAGDAT